MNPNAYTNPTKEDTTHEYTPLCSLLTSEYLFKREGGGVGACEC